MDGFHEKIDRIMAVGLEERVFPGAVLLVSVGGRVVLEKAWGVADIYTAEKVTPDTVFDLASLTKPLAGATSVMALVSRGVLNLETRVGDLLPDFRGTDKGRIRLVNLLCHNSGLPDYRPYYRELRLVPEAERDGRLRELLLREPLCCGIGEKVVYSDLGYMLVRMMVEAAAGMPLDAFVREEVFGPLGVSDLFYLRKGEARPHRRFAATELSPWRGGILSGVVHDENAYVMGRVSAHAGLFGTARGVHGLLARLAEEYGGEGRGPFWGSDIVRLFMRRYGETGRTPGFDMPSPGGSSSGEKFSAESVGHLGFTGTSFWLDLEKRVAVVLLTNRVHPIRSNWAIKKFRPFLHNAVMEGALDCAKVACK